MQLALSCHTSATHGCGTMWHLSPISFQTSAVTDSGPLPLLLASVYNDRITVNTLA